MSAIKLNQMSDALERINDGLTAVDGKDIHTTLNDVNVELIKMTAVLDARIADLEIVKKRLEEQARKSKEIKDESAPTR